MKNGGSWVSEGMASYLSHLVLLKAGFVSEEEYKHMVRIEVTNGDEAVGEPVDATADNKIYQKCEAVFAAVDMHIRAKTNGRKDVMDFVRALNQQRANDSVFMTEERAKRALESVIGEREAVLRGVRRVDCVPRHPVNRRLLVKRP